MCKTHNILAWTYSALKCLQCLIQHQRCIAAAIWYGDIQLSLYIQRCNFEYFNPKAHNLWIRANCSLPRLFICKLILLTSLDLHFCLWEYMVHSKSIFTGFVRSTEVSLPDQKISRITAFPVIFRLSESDQSHSLVKTDQKTISIPIWPWQLVDKSFAKGKTEVAIKKSFIWKVERKERASERETEEEMGREGQIWLETDQVETRATRPLLWLVRTPVLEPAPADSHPGSWHQEWSQDSNPVQMSASRILLKVFSCLILSPFLLGWTFFF